MTSNGPTESNSRKSIVVSCTSATGGVGKSSIAILLAATLAKSSQKAFEDGSAERILKVVVVDMDTRDGSLAEYLGVTDSPNLYGRDEAEMTRKSLRNYIARVPDLGFDLLPSPWYLSHKKTASAEVYRTIVKELRGQYDVVVLDTATSYTDPLIRSVCYPMSDRILFVTDHGLSSLLGAGRWFMEANLPASNGGMGIENEKVSVVANKAIAAEGDDTSRVSRSVNDMEVLATIPSLPTRFREALTTHRFTALLDTSDVVDAFFVIASKVVNGLYPLTKSVTTVRSLVSDVAETPPKRVGVWTRFLRISK